ncbi:MAG: Asp-tRNA(Asn)/Glu-tRNA(Gln) amidotransferase subunit GatA [SAR202 cluster bacterium]|nr:Asp-tRNA(Asn)/Glu-tRNA(Gln) amidotransferase subunit GatA [SAR202 cluster bacterium]|tara:strand:+ start:7460 stop:8908 length:1449 start_codon:yes stop_codon:yes gene_type:complete
MPAIPYESITQLSKALHAKEVSSEDIFNCYVKRISELDPEIGSFITTTFELGLEQATLADKIFAKGKASTLTGIPMQLKDNISTQGILTTCASKMLSNYLPPYDATVTKQLNKSGSVLLGKGNMDEFAMGSSNETSAYKYAKNPWNPLKVPGGSSGGPAAAVAAGLSAFALGSDTGGSIRQPAAFCGVVGLKPTYGLVSRFGLIAFASSLDQIGPITNTVMDSAIVLNVIAGHDPMDSTSLNVSSTDYTANLNQGIRSLRVGVVKEFITDNIDPRVSLSVQNAIHQLEDLGASITEISLPTALSALAVYYILAPSECSANLARYDGVKYGFSETSIGNIDKALDLTRRNGFGEEVKRRIMMGTYALSSGYYDAYYKKAQQVRTLIRQEFEKAFEQVDILALPTTPSTAFDIGGIVDPIVMHANDICTIPANIAGIPGITVPCGLVDDLPVGLQLLGPPLSESILLQCAHNYESSVNWKELKN